MKKPHHNTGRKNALKTGRTKAITVRVTPEVYEYLKSCENSAADKVELLVLDAIAVEKLLVDAAAIISE